jgi:outer membrane protein TolC
LTGLPRSLPRQARPLFIGAALGCALWASGCAVTTEPLRTDEVADRVRGDRERMYSDQEPVRAPLTLEEAAARAIKYNLDYRLQLMESALQQGVLEVSQFDMLPRLTASAGYVARDNELYSQYQTLGEPYDSNLPYSRSTESARRLAGAELSWNLLDFGVSYYRARAQSDQVLIAEERKRKVIQNVMQDVRSAYWRALGAQRLAQRLDDLLARTGTALERAREIERQGLLPVPQALAYQRALLDTLTQLQTRRQDLELARSELAALMNLPPGTKYSLSDLAEADLPAPPASVAELEDVALNGRPELREEDYRKRVSASEVRRALASTLPAVSFDIGANYDSNKFLLNNAWVEGGIQVSLNLFRLAAIPAIKRHGEVQEQVDETRRMAQAMAILTQVRVATLRYGLARSEYDTFSQSAGVDDRLAGYARASSTSQVESELELIRSEARALLSEYQRHIAYANAQAAWGRLYNSLGLDVEADDSAVPVRALAIRIRHSLLRWQARTFDTVPLGSIETLPIAVVIDGVDDDAQQAAVARVFTEALQGRGMRVVQPPDQDPLTAWRLQARRRMTAAAAGSQEVEWAIELARPNGSSAGRTLYSSVVPAAASAETRRALTQVAASLNADVVIDWLGSERERVLALRR